MKTVILKYLVFVFLIGLFVNTKSEAQEVDVSDYRMYFKFNTIKQPDNSRLLEVSFTGRNKKDRKDVIPIFGAEIKFFNILNDEEVVLGSSKTSQDGVAQFHVPENQQYLVDGEGNITLKAQFEGSDALDVEEEEIIVKNVFLDLNLEEIDSVKTVIVKAFVMDSIGTKMSVDEVDINIYIDGMLSKMKVQEGTIVNGEFEYTYESSVPGDKDGNVTMFAMIEDNDDFGKVIQKNSAGWGILNNKADNGNHKLWSKAGPIWMYIVLTFLLVGVWANYIYTIVNLFKIKKEGSNLNT